MRLPPRREPAGAENRATTAPERGLPESSLTVPEIRARVAEASAGAEKRDDAPINIRQPTTK